MGIFFFIDDVLINLDDPVTHVKDEYREYFARKELAPFILSEICALDMLYIITEMNDGYYKDRLVLKVISYHSCSLNYRILLIMIHGVLLVSYLDLKQRWIRHR